FKFGLGLLNRNGPTNIQHEVGHAVHFINRPGWLIDGQRFGLAKPTLSGGCGMTAQHLGVSLRFDNISVSFGAAYQLFLEHLKLPAGQIAALLGPSGCGKSTLLNLAAGYLSSQSGAVYHDDQALNGPAANTALLFQQRNLFPWMTALENISFAL